VNFRSFTIKKLSPSHVARGLIAATLLAACGYADLALAAGEAEHPKHMEWPFDGMTGHLDKQAAQRGFQVYKQVCSACHGMSLVSYRNLGQIGFEEAEIKAIAAEKEIEDLDEKGSGERVMRKAKPFDKFVSPFPNDDAARVANGGALPPDLSLIIKARENGPNYVFSLLTGFGNPPAGHEIVAGKHYNPYFPGGWISMAAPLSEGAVEYQDGTKATVDQMAHDVVIFLQWASEPEMDSRKAMGMKVLVFLSLLTAFFFVAKRRVWKNIEH
jgi:ubiquinol-cytochrome c reductase cytochrome c1 subunit